MLPSFMHIGAISVLVAIDNALLAGLLVANVLQSDKLRVTTYVGSLVGVVQIVFAIGVGHLLNNLAFRLVAILILVVMAVRTIDVFRSSLMYRDSGNHRMTFKIFVYTLMGNLDNMIWLGSEVKTHYAWLVFFSLVTVPVFITIAHFLSKECERHSWVLLVGAGMMAWTASSLVLETRIVQVHWISPLVFRCLFTACILLIGFVVTSFREDAWRRRSR